MSGKRRFAGMVKRVSTTGVGRRPVRVFASVLATAFALSGSLVLAQSNMGDQKGATAPKKSANSTAKGQSKSETDGPSGSPKISVDLTTVQFGDVWAGDKVEHSWVVRNEGTEILKIITVKPSCGCTVAKTYDREILPGATGKIPIIINTTRLRAKVSKTVTVTCNDPKNSTIRLSISGNVKQRVNIDPPKGGTFGRIKPNETVKRTLTLTNNTESPIKLSLMAPTTKTFTAELTEKKPGQVYELALKTQPPYQDKYNRGQIKLRTNIPEQPIITIPTNVYALPQVEITPPEIIIPKATPASRKQPIRVTFNTDEPYKVLSATVDGDIKTTIVETRKNYYTVTLDIPANYFPPVAGQKVTLKTDFPDKPEVVVNIGRKRTPPVRKTPPKPATLLSGQPAPPATFVLADGKSVSTTEKDDVSLYMFYASWCGYCKKALPQLSTMAKDYEASSKPVRFVGISQDTLVEDGADPNNRRARTKEQVSQQWSDMGISFPQAFDPMKAGTNKFKVRGFPTMFLVGKSGKVERVYSGIGDVMNGRMKQDIDTLVSGKPLAPQKIAAQPATPRQRPAQTMQGKMAPKATFVTSTGSSFNSVEPGKVSLLKFYASWCPHCKKALPKVEAISQELKGKPVRFAAISLDQLVEHGADPKNRRTKTKDFVIKQFKDLGATFTQAFDPSNAGKNLFKVSSFPTMFLIDQQGKINKVYVGGGAAQDGSLKRDIEALLKRAS